MLGCDRRIVRNRSKASGRWPIPHATICSDICSPSYHDAGRRTHLEIWPASDDGRLCTSRSEQFQIETNVGTGPVGLMDFHGKHIVAAHKITDRDACLMKIYVVDGCRCQRAIADGSAGHVAAK